jgi:hypothetical protein
LVLTSSNDSTFTRNLHAPALLDRGFGTGEEIVVGSIPGKRWRIGRDWASRLDDELGSALQTSNRTVHAALRVGFCGLGYAG